ncbi:Methyltransferase [Candidatus Desulfarcum epimagneticum]|uniref:Methyltransferase n=1 Tax=uncultured Desulfobacteraceae bacterium TaxID=218296 RepID=A0A484HLP6_9BACT|nr:Methyltransferase [uncultured Desulfobacteraceae bacterium]
MTNNNIIHRNRCRLCNSNKLDIVLKYNPTPLADEYIPKEYINKEQKIYPLNLFLCKKCGLSQLLDVVQPQDIYFDYLYETKTSLGLVNHFQSYAEEVLKISNSPKGSLVVDIGSNDGSLLKAFKKKGMKALGIDPARDIAKKATESGIETLPLLFNVGVADKIKEKHGFAEVITMNNLFANIDDLIGAVKGVRRLMAPEGVFVIESFYLYDLIKNMVFDFIYHEHLSCFSVKPLQIFFKSQNMELIDVQHISTKGGSLRYIVKHAQGRRSISPNIAKYIKRETSFGIHESKIFKTFSKQIKYAKNSLLNIIRDLQKNKKTIAGYGASATTTTLLYSFDLIDKLNFIVDDNPQRQGLYSPGCHIPVVSPKTLYEQKKPDYVLILAWRYAEPIIKQHQDFLTNGGHFIIPLPEIKVF